MFPFKRVHDGVVAVERPEVVPVGVVAQIQLLFLSGKRLLHVEPMHAQLVEILPQKREIAALSLYVSRRHILRIEGVFVGHDRKHKAAALTFGGVLRQPDGLCQAVQRTRRKRYAEIIIECFFAEQPTPFALDHAVGAAVQQTQAQGVFGVDQRHAQRILLGEPRVRLGGKAAVHAVFVHQLWKFIFRFIADGFCAAKKGLEHHRHTAEQQEHGDIYDL